MSLSTLFTVLILIFLYSLVWHDKPARETRGDRRIDGESLDATLRTCRAERTHPHSSPSKRIS